MIREATQADIPVLVDMGVRFLRLHYADKLKENREQMQKTVISLLANPQSKVLVGGNGHGLEGMLAFLVYPHFFSGEPIAGELVWWVEPEARGNLGLELLRKAERMAQEMGATWMQMIAPSERTAELYSRLGYAPVETTFQRRLT